MLERWLTLVGALAALVAGQLAVPQTALAATVPSPPGKPTAVVNTEADNWVYLNWTPPTDSGGLPHECYNWTRHPDGVQGEPMCSYSTFDIDSTAKQGQTYWYTVVATNALGSSDPSPASDPVVIPAAVPDRPAAPTMSATSRSVTATWLEPYDGGSPITGYRVDLVRSSGSPVESSTRTMDAAARTATFENLSPGTSYQVSLVAINGVGESEASPAKTIGTRIEPPELTGPPVAEADGSVTWPAAEANGGSVHYTLTASPGGMTWDVAWGAPLRVVPTGLPAGRTYTFTLVATNGAGSTAPSEPSNPLVIPAVKPDAVKNLQVSLGDETATVTWTPPVEDGGPLTHYRVRAKPMTGDDEVDLVVPTEQTTATLTGLTNGEWYSFVVEAHNAAGYSSAASSFYQLPRVVPEAPASPLAVAEDTTLTVTWSAPADNGSPITGYTVTMENIGIDSNFFSVVRQLGPDATSTVFTKLPRGTSATVSITATNARGTSDIAWAYASIHAVAPDAPATPTAVRGDRSAKVSWTAPANNGAPVTSYKVTVSPGGRTLTASADSRTLHVGGLTNGTSYRFSVSAINSAGTSVPSAYSAAVVPAGRPGAVPRVRAVVDGRAVTVRWRRAFANGSRITRYVVVRKPGADLSVRPGARSARFKRLAPGVHTFKVAAVNAVGRGPVTTTIRIRVR